MPPRRLRLRAETEPDTNTPFEPPSPTGYALPLVLVILICAAYISWRRRQRMRNESLEIRPLSRGPSGVRLSTDDDGPSAHSFLTNNASTDSLPADANLPVLPGQSQSSRALQSSLLTSPSTRKARNVPWTRDKKDYKGKHARRSSNLREPLEPDEDDSDASEEHHSTERKSRSHEGGSEAKAQTGDVFSIGGDEDNPAAE